MSTLCLLQTKCKAISTKAIYQINAGVTNITETTSLHRDFSKSSKDFNFLSSAGLFSSITLAKCNIFHDRFKSDQIDISI
jgi:hypothetical protein